MKLLITILFLFSLSMVSFAAGNNASPNFCEWLGDSASLIAQNRDRGIGEYDLIGEYLSDDISYGEQSVIIPLIDRVYGIESHINPKNIAIVEQTQCEIALINLESK